jgi:AraC-like DNA-binding protein
MSQPPKTLPLEGALVQSVTIVDQLTRTVPGTYRAVSLPGHLLHLVVAGEVDQEVNGHTQRLAPGTAVWYYEDEAVTGRILHVPWTFYTVNFQALRLLPPSCPQRAWPAGPQAVPCFQALLDAWRDTTVLPMVRHLRVFSRLMQLLAEVLPQGICRHRADAATQLWWEIEAHLREDLSQPVNLNRLQTLGRRSLRSILCGCRAATGTSPMKRVKEIRLSYARGLVLHSRLPMTEIALRVGYGRVQEMSRDYHRQFGLTPRADRRAGPDYDRPRPVESESQH